MWTRCLTTFAALLAIGVAGPALAAQQTVLLRAMVITDPQPGIDPSRRRIGISAYERASDNTVVGDPLASGATLFVIAKGGTTTSQTFVLPAGAPASGGAPGWTAKVGPTKVLYKYVDPKGLASAVKNVLFSWAVSSDGTARFKMKFAIKARPGVPVDVVPPNPGTEAGAIFTINGGDAYCVLLGGIVGGDFDGGAREWKGYKPLGEACPVP
jgi:hypothetical protein